MKRKKANPIVYYITGVLFILAALLSKTITYVPIGCLWLILGINETKKNKND